MSKRTEVFVIVDWPEGNETGSFVEIETRDGAGVRVPCANREDGLYSFGPLWYEEPE